MYCLSLNIAKLLSFLVVLNAQLAWCQEPSVTQPSVIEQSVTSVTTPFGTLHENEDKSGKNVSFNEYAEKFASVQEIVDQQGLEKAALFCGTGVFAIYAEPHYESLGGGIKILAQTKEACVPPGHAASIQLLQNIADVTEGTIAIFENENFGGLATKINDKFLLITKATSVQSFITIGKSFWGITTTKGSYCLSPKQDMDFPICPVSLSTDLFEHTEDLEWITLRKWCGVDTTDLPLPYCFNGNSGSLENSTLTGAVTPAPGSDLTTTTESTGTGTGAGNGTCGDYSDEFAMLLRLRLTHNFDSLYQVVLPVDKIHSWRTEILDNTIEIVASSVLEGLTNVRLLRFIRELYIYLAEKHVWSQGTGWPARPKDKIFIMAHQTQQCLFKIEQKSWNGITRELGSGILSKLTVPVIDESDIDLAFRTVKGFDITMEFIWQCINFVGVVCHSALEFQTDFWMDYMSITYDMYLSPMASYWKNPGKFLKHYSILLAGFDITQQYRGLALTTSLLYKSSSLDKLPRPLTVTEGTA